MGHLARRSSWSAGLVLVAACTTFQRPDRGTDRYDPQMLAKALDQHDPGPGIIIGEFPLAPHAIADGDTIKVEGLSASLRLLGLDTEETFKTKDDLDLYQRLGLAGYLAKKGEHTDRPVKCATPMGMEAKYFAQHFFADVMRVRLERDHPKEIRDRYNRLLAYVFVERDGEWVNYNVEVIRAGMSPYFSKYGYSRRFHDEFVQAQREAQAAERGIWDPKREHYFDYDVRLQWWNARADFIDAFEREAEQNEDLIVLTNWDAMDRLAASEGQEIELLGGVGTIRKGGGRSPTRVALGRRMFSDFPLIFFDDEVYETSRIESARGEFVRVRGTVQTYVYKSRRDREDDREQLQIVVRVPEQIQVSDTAPKGFATHAELRDDDPEELPPEDPASPVEDIAVPVPSETPAPAPTTTVPPSSSTPTPTRSNSPAPVAAPVRPAPADSSLPVDFDAIEQQADSVP